MFPWDHNAYYHRLLLREVPDGAARVLDVGCGAGRLAGELAARARRVDAIDRDPTMVDLARRRVPANVDVIRGDVLTATLEPGYDAVVSMSALHHLPLATALPVLADLVRPGGVLAVVALPRRDLPRDLPVELAATTWHHAVGAALAVTRGRVATGIRHEPGHDRMPVRRPDLTTREVRATAEQVLPGVRVRRLVLWRYLLLWRRREA